jgi:hypothetical protein
MKMRKVLLVLLVLLSLTGIIVACGGGGGGGGAAPAPMAPPAFTNLAGTRWNQTDTVSATNACGTAIGVQDAFVLHVLAQSGNTISVYDERSGALAAVSGSMSGYVVTYSGTRYPVQCTSMSASYSVTVNAGETAYTGTGTITCNDPPACSVQVDVTGAKI